MKLDTFISVRVPVKLRDAVHRKATRYGNPSDVLREILSAFVNDRLTVQPDPKKESLYVPRKQA